MLRHRLAPLFEPHSLVVVSDRNLSVLQTVPGKLDKAVTRVAVTADQSVQMPAHINGIDGAGRVDAALVCVAPQRVPQVLDALSACRPRALVLLRHAESSSNPVEDFVYCQTWARLNGCQLLGPHSSGLQRPAYGLNLSQEPKPARAGRVALVTQSQSIMEAVLDWADDIALGFSTAISLGDEAAVDAAAVLDFLAMDSDTDSIVLYLDSASSSRHFTSALRAAAGVKPVVVLKTGHGTYDPVSSHDAVFNALLRRAGAVRVRYFVQLFSALKVLTHARRLRGRRIALFSNGHGAAQLALDAMGPGAKVECAKLSQATVTALRGLLEERAQLNNPVVSQAPLTADVVDGCVQALVQDSGVDGVLVLLTPDPLADIAAVVDALARLSRKLRKPVVISLLGDAAMRPLRHVLDKIGAPAFRTPETAANAYGILASYHYNQVLSQQVLPPEPLALPANVARAHALVNEVRQSGRHDLTPEEINELFACFHIPVTHNAMPLRQPDFYENRAPMAVRVHQDPKFGPFFSFGIGGQQSLLSARDDGVDLPPLNGYLARQLVQRSTLWHRALSRELSHAGCEALQEALERISDLVCDTPDVKVLEIDNLFVRGTQLWAGSVILRLGDARLVCSPQATGYSHMAIHPYPTRLVQVMSFDDASPWTLRPIRPEDAQALQLFIRGLSDESRYMRFVSMLRELTPTMLSRYTRIDYDRELALIAAAQRPNPQHRGYPRDEIIGFAHYLRNPDGRGAEYALVIGDAWQHRKLGQKLMRVLVQAAREQGLSYLEGVVLTGNRPMIRLMTWLGFKNDSFEEDPTMRRVWIDLTKTQHQSNV